MRSVKKYDRPHIGDIVIFKDYTNCDFDLKSAFEFNKKYKVVKILIPTKPLEKIGKNIVRVEVQNISPFNSKDLSHFIPFAWRFKLIGRQCKISFNNIQIWDKNRQLKLMLTRGETNLNGK